jgi:putative transposase
MVHYRRNRIEGASYFFTATLRDRRSDVLLRHVSALRAAFRAARDVRPFSIDAIVVLPEHLHTIWTLPADDHDYPARWKAVKSGFTRAVREAGEPLQCSSKGEYDLWQRRYWEHTLRDGEDVARHIDYIHFNPVKHGLVQKVVDWPHSSFHRYVERGVYPVDWGLAASLGLRAGER